jgi:hypothetical protein
MVDPSGRPEQRKHEDIDLQYRGKGMCNDKRS